jgi:hypothetical protein
MVGAGVFVGMSIVFGARPHADSARFKDTAPLHLRKSRREIFFDTLPAITLSLGYALNQQVIYGMNSHDLLVI